MTFKRWSVNAIILSNHSHFRVTWNNPNLRVLKKKRRKRKNGRRKKQERKKERSSRKKSNFVSSVGPAKNPWISGLIGVTRTGHWTKTEITRDTRPVKRKVALSRASTKLSHPLSSIFARLFRSRLVVSSERWFDSSSDLLIRCSDFFFTLPLYNAYTGKPVSNSRRPNPSYPSPWYLVRNCTVLAIIEVAFPPTNRPTILDRYTFYLHAAFSLLSIEFAHFYASTLQSDSIALRWTNGWVNRVFCDFFT